MDKVIMALFGNTWFIGRAHQSGELMFLTEPLIYIFNGTAHNLLHIPGDPPEICIDGADLAYEVKESPTLTYYLKSTSVLTVPPGDIIVMSS